MILRAVLYSSMVVSAAGFLTSVYLLWRFRERPGILHWLAGAACVFVGLLTAALFFDENGHPALLLSKCLSFLAPTLLGHSLRRFFRRPGSHWPDYAFFAISCTILITVDCFFEWSAPASNSLQGLLMGLLFLHPAAMCLELDGKNPEGRNFFLGGALGLVAFFAVARALSGFAADLAGPQDATALQIAYQFSAPGMWLAVLVGYVTLVNRRLAAELEHESEELRASNELRDRFMRVLAHDLRGPMGATAIGLELLAEEAQEDPGSNPIRDEANRALLDDAARQTRALYNLIEDLLNWAHVRIRSNVFSPRILTLAEILEPELELLRPRAEAKHVELDAPEAMMQELCWADRDVCRSLFRNLLSNALKYSHRGGRIELGAQVEDDFLQVEVRDEGVGFDAASREREQAQSGADSRRGTEGEAGAGMGLQLAEEYMRGTGGELKLHSEPGKGTRAVVRLPRSAPKKRA